MDQLQQDYPYLDWLVYINALLPDGVTIDRFEVVTVLYNDFFERLGEILNKTPSRVIANYLMWHVADDAAPHLHDLQTQSMKAYRASLELPNREMKPKWRECVETANI